MRRNIRLNSITLGLGGIAILFSIIIRFYIPIAIIVAIGIAIKSITYLHSKNKTKTGKLTNSTNQLPRSRAARYERFVNSSTQIT